MKTQIKQTLAKLSALAFMFALVVGVAPQSSALVDATREVAINAEVVDSLQLEVDSGTVNIQVDPDVDAGQNWSGTGAVDATSTTQTTVNTNNEGGYKLQIKLVGATATGTAVLDGSGTTTNTIPTFGTQTGARASENIFSYALNDDDATNTVQFTNASTDIYPQAGLTSATNSDTEDIYYYLNVDYTTESDTYKGTITYTAVTL